MAGFKETKPLPVATAPPREFRFTADDFERVRELIYQRAGIALASTKQDMVYARLTRRLRAYGYRTFSQYLAHLQSGDKNEWQIFINALTTNLTSFFREAHHFDVLTRQLERSSQRPFRIWCSAASSGEEPYSLAITACETFKTMTPPVSIIASDVDTHVLDIGRRGRYPADRVARLDPERIRQFFVEGCGEEAGTACVRTELKKLVSFTRINLLDVRWPQQGAFDAIFCRNVMIYFDKPTQYAILKRFRPLLRAGGLLYAGHSESFSHATDLFRSLGRTVYEGVDP